MTRKEEIKIIADKYCLDEYTRLGFVAGAEWADSHHHWRSVKEELPPSNTPVLIASTRGTIDVSLHDRNQIGWIENNEKIPYWMPLPQPPVLSNVERTENNWKEMGWRQGAWISVVEELPPRWDKNPNVSVPVITCKYVNRELQEIDLQRYIFGDGKWQYCDATHWMPFKFPEEGGEK